jgi:hypothetical protein
MLNSDFPQRFVARAVPSAASFQKQIASPSNGADEQNGNRNAGNRQILL